MNHVKPRDASRDVWKAAGAAALDGEERREVGREQGDEEKENAEESKVGDVCGVVRPPLLEPVWTGRLVTFLTAPLPIQVYFLLHEREGAGGDGCCTPHPGCCSLPRRSSPRRPQGGSVSPVSLSLPWKNLNVFLGKKNDSICVPVQGWK